MREKLIELCYKSTLDMPLSLGLANDLIKGGVTIQKWIPVTERLPENDGEVVLVCGSRKGIYTAEFRKKEKWTWFHKLNSKSHHCEPTHWMPLPEPPKGA